MRGHNIYFHWEIRKLSLNYPQYPLLSGALLALSHYPIFNFEVPQSTFQDNVDEAPQTLFLWRNKKNNPKLIWTPFLFSAMRLFDSWIIYEIGPLFWHHFMLVPSPFLFLFHLFCCHLPLYLPYLHHHFPVERKWKEFLTETRVTFRGSNSAHFFSLCLLLKKIDRPYLKWLCHPQKQTEQIVEKLFPFAKMMAK